MTKKVLLVTLEGTSNFGNRLQHYALQRAIEDVGFQTDSLMVKTLPSRVKNKMKNAVKSILVLGGLRKYCPSLSVGKRTEKFLAFNEKYLSGIVRMPDEKVRNSNWEEYTCAVTGSDQVWHNWNNPMFSDELSYYYLEFLDPSKRVSYAPSFGFTAFPEEDLAAHRRGLLGMRALSCREQEGCDLIRELTGRDAQKVLDPTLLLTADEWVEIENKPDFVTSGPYLLQFFLGKVTPEYRSEIDRIATERGLRVIDINDKNDPTHFAISPDEFVWLIHHADTVCTDSFHATVFSVTFEKNLRVFRREQAGFKDMFGRLHDLLEPLSLSSLVYGEGDGLSATLSADARRCLEHEREASLLYLKKSLTAE